MALDVSPDGTSGLQSSWTRQAPVVSIIIPTYNSAQFVTSAVDSALGQTYRDVEIIVVDDGSQDSTRSVLAPYAGRIRYLRQENRGLAGARNTGIRVATGEFVGLLDADDQWRPDYLETMVLLARERDAAVCYCQARCMSADGDDLPQVLGGPPVASTEIRRKLLRANFLIPSTILARRSVLLAADLFDEALRSCEDWDLWLRLPPATSIAGTDAQLVRYRIHGSSLSTDPSSMQHAVRTVIEKHFGHDDQQEHTWSVEKRRAYGGAYRYHALTCVLRQRDWPAAGVHLRRAFEADPTLTVDLDLFYELALGSQPVGYRGMAEKLDLVANAAAMLNALNEAQPSGAGVRAVWQMWGTAYFALGLLAYNTGNQALCARFLPKAIYYRPHLWRDFRVGGSLLKMLIGQSRVRSLKHHLRG